ncbi:MAG: antitoxin [Actinobacteria bacterium]|nr:antitoxin [Actinomycetota bacterium]
MRTTLNLDDDILAVARTLADAEQRSLGEVISALARRGLAPPAARLSEEDGFPVFSVADDAPPITSEMVEAALDEL